MTHRENWNNCRHQQEYLGLLLLLGVVSKIVTVECLLYKQTCRTLGVELLQWSQLSSPTGRQKYRLLQYIPCDSTSWDISCIRRLRVLSDMGIFKITFSYSSPKTIFTILEHAGKMYGPAIVCDFMSLSRFQHRLLERCQKRLWFWSSVEPGVFD
jgi:hypothetical protein